MTTDNNAPSAPGIPHSRRAEEAVVGSLLINPDIFHEVRAECEAEDFYLDRLRWIFQAIEYLVEKKEPVDLLTVTERLSSLDLLVELGGPSFLTSLVNQVPSSYSAPAYAKKIKEHATRRKLLLAANRVATLAYDESQEIENVVGGSYEAIDKVSNDAIKGEHETINTVISRVYDRTDKNSRLEPEERDTGLKTGFIDLDNILKGVKSDNLVIAAGRPGMGKSGFLLSVASNIAVTGVRHQGPRGFAIFSHEMSNDEIGTRLLAQMTGIDSTRIESGNLMDDEWSILTNAIDTIDAARDRLILDDTPAMTPQQIRAKLIMLKARYNIAAFGVDYLQLMRGRGDNRTQEIGYISRSLKAIAKELDITAFALAQLSREVEKRADKRPILSDLRDSGELEQDSDKVIFIYRAEQYGLGDPGIAEIIVAKNRQGPVGVAELVFQKQTTRFMDATKRLENKNAIQS